MSQTLTISRPFHIKRSHRGRKRLHEGNEPQFSHSKPIPRIARLMALAIHYDQLIRQGEIADMTELARLTNVSRARITQVMNLLNLAPEIQEYLLFMERSPQGRDTIHERGLREVCEQLDWQEQRTLWAGMIPGEY